MNNIFVEEQNRKKEEDRIITMKNLFWESGTNKEESVITETLWEFDIVDSTKINWSMCKEIFMLLPDTIFGSIISWGIQDTEVKDEIYTFIKKKIEEGDTKFFTIISSN